MADSYKTAWRKRTRAWAVDLLGGRCVQCGTSKTLEFDHIDPKSKTIDISGAIRASWSRKRITAELAKCQLLCKKHHVEKSAINHDNTGGGWNRVRNPRHGTAVMYHREGCRCKRCRRWRQLYRLGLVDTRNRRVSALPFPPAKQSRSHGTRAMYIAGCRCDLCRAAQAAYMRGYMRERRTHLR